MLPGVFSGPKPVLEIKYGTLATLPITSGVLTAARPQSPFVVFYGDPSESPSAELVGKLVLNNPEPISVRSIKLSFTGMRKISYVHALFLALHTGTDVGPDGLPRRP
jgi:hypothetical protein